MASQAPGQPAPPPESFDENRSGELIAITWTFFTVSLLCTAARMFTRAKLRHNLWWDDFVLCFTTFLAIGFSVGFTFYAKYGGAMHVWAVARDPATLVEVTKINWVSQVFCILSISTGKIAVALLISRIMAPSKWRRITLWVLCSLTMVLALIVIIVIFTQCKPGYALWDQEAGVCYNLDKTNKFDMAVASYFAFVDFFLALFPITIVYKLQLSLMKKIGLSLLLGLGVFAAVCAAIKTSYLPTLTAESDFTWLTVGLLEWNVVEVNVIIIAACIPVIRPLFLKAKGVVHKHAKPAPPPKDSRWMDDTFGSDTIVGAATPAFKHHIANQAKPGHPTSSMSTQATQVPHCPNCGHHVRKPSETKPEMTHTRSPRPITPVLAPPVSLRASDAQPSSERLNTTWLDIEASVDGDQGNSPPPPNAIKQTTSLDVMVEMLPKSTRAPAGHGRVPPPVAPLQSAPRELPGNSLDDLDPRGVSAEYARHIV